MTTSAHKTEGANRTKTVRFYSFVFLPERMRTACDRSGANGNGASSRGTRRTDNARGQFETGRFLFWTEDSRMHAAVDDKHYSYYAYDYTGQRTLKMTGDASTVDLNAQLQQIVSGLNRVTIYPSPYLVLTEQGYTKHYYAGADRVCARLGSGGLDHDTACISRNEEVSTRVENLFWHGLKLVDAKEFKPEIIKELQLVDIHGKELDWLKNVDIEKLLMRLQISVKPDPWSIHKIIDDLVRERPDDEPEVYFYHSDHLGGASWITDGSGKPVQHLQYLPFGEPFVDQHPAGYQERFRFTGKERDEETGYGYFGARYMDHELMTSFISVDRYASKYPFISPYAYCAWNPIRLIDPTGDTLFALDRQSQTDIMNLAGSYRDRILFDDRGVASIDYSGLSDEEINKMNADLGVGLIKDICDSPLKILYESSDMIRCTDNDGNEITGYMGTDNNGVLNLSRGGKDSYNNHTYLPREGFDGQVIVSPNGMWSSRGLHVIRLEIVGHELAENYARTVHNCNYHPDKNGTAPMAEIGAHEYANRRMHNSNKAYTYKHNKRKK